MGCVFFGVDTPFCVVFKGNHKERPDFLGGSLKKRLKIKQAGWRRF